MARWGEPAELIEETEGIQEAGGLRMAAACCIGRLGRHYFAWLEAVTLSFGSNVSLISAVDARELGFIFKVWARPSHCPTQEASVQSACLGTARVFSSSGAP
jgi:hypothetical protein